MGTSSVGRQFLVRLNIRFRATPTTVPRGPAIVPRGEPKFYLAESIGTVRDCVSGVHRHIPSFHFHDLILTPPFFFPGLRD
jgi:hypothetical protein